MLVEVHDKSVLPRSVHVSEVASKAPVVELSHHFVGELKLRQLDGSVFNLDRQNLLLQAHRV